MTVLPGAICCRGTVVSDTRSPLDVHTVNFASGVIRTIPDDDGVGLGQGRLRAVRAQRRGAERGHLVSSCVPHGLRLQLVDHPHPAVGAQNVYRYICPYVLEESKSAG